MIPMLIAGCQGEAENTKAPYPAPQAVAKPVSPDVPIENPLAGMSKSLDDLERGLRGVDKLSINQAAEKIAQVDEWLFIPDAEEKARQRIDREVDKLRGRIDKRIRELSTEAIKAKEGKSASEKMATINSLLLLYPAPSNEAQRKNLEQLSAGVLSASRRIEDIRRLRYNDWAITRIQGGLAAYRWHLKVKNVSDLFSTDRDALIKSSVSWMNPIDPSFLEPAVMDLYDYVLGLTRDAMDGDDKKRIELTRGFSNPDLQRKTPADF